MSGLKPLALTQFYASLHDRGVTTTVLADAVGVSGGAIRRLITGHRRRKGPTWENLCQWLTPREIGLLNTVEQSSTWNVKQPLWTPEKAQRLAQSHAA